MENNLDLKQALCDVLKKLEKLEQEIAEIKKNQQTIKSDVNVIRSRV